MGRARRNQRDAQRKQRIKRRKKNNPGSDDDDSDGIDIDHNSLSREPACEKEANPPAENTEQTELKPSASTNAVERRASSTIAKAKGASLPASAKVATIKKPVDRIERMRLKKQQQKTRNKEKKAARAAATATQK